MQTESQVAQTERFARCVAISKRVRWDIEKGVIRGRSFDAAHKFLRPFGDTGNTCQLARGNLLQRLKQSWGCSHKGHSAGNASDQHLRQSELPIALR